MGTIFQMNQASKAVRQIAREAAHMFGRATGWQPASTSGIYIQFSGDPAPRYYSGNDIADAAEESE